MKTPRRAIYKDVVLLQLFAAVFLIDQLTKFLVREFVEFRDSVPAEGFFRITHTFNTGSAFGLFRDQNLPLIVVSVVGIAILILIYRSQARPGKLLRLSLGMQFGGAAGNLLDRLRAGRPVCEGVLGHDETVLPALENALLSGHDLAGRRRRRAG